MKMTLAEALKNYHEEGLKSLAVLKKLMQDADSAGNAEAYDALFWAIVSLKVQCPYLREGEKNNDAGNSKQ